MAIGGDQPPPDPAGLPWSEHHPDNESTFDMSFSAAGPAKASMVVQVAGDDFDDEVFAKWLGYAQVGEGNKLIRTLPHVHPVVPWLWADNVSRVIGLAERGRRGIVGGTNYDRYAMTIGYSSRPYYVLSDKDIEKEWERFVEWQVLPKSKLIASEREGWKVSDMAATGTCGRVDNNTPLKGSQGTLDVVRHIKMIWYLVPPTFYRKLNGLMPNIDSVVGKVNSNTWPGADGYPAGTLLCEDPEIVDEEAPVHPARIWGQQESKGGRRSPVLSRVTFNFKYTDPSPSSAVRGWNLFKAEDGFWYNGVRNVAGSTKQQYETADFDKLFQKVA